MNINVKLSNSRGNSRTNKISAKETSKKAHTKIIDSSSNSGISFKNSGKFVSSTASFMSGKEGAMASAFTKIPVIGALYMGMKTAENIGQFGANIYEARTGNEMIASNAKAKLKTGASFGTNLLSGYINNYLFTQPKITRQNQEREYGRDLYFQNGFDEKNKLS